MICDDLTIAHDLFDVDLISPMMPHVLNWGRVSWWLVLPGLDGGAQLIDICQRGNNATLTNTATSVWQGTPRPGGFGQITLDGTNDYGAIGAPASLSLESVPMTVSCWFRSSIVDSAAHYIFTDQNAATLCLFRLNQATTNQIRFTAKVNNAGSVLGSTVISANVWYHVVGVRSGATGNWTNSLYLNGVSDATPVNSANDPAAIQDLRIGVNGAASSPLYFGGQIDDVSIWSRALSASEVYELYTQSRLGYPDLLRRESVYSPLRPEVSGNRIRRVICSGVC